MVANVRQGASETGAGESSGAGGYGPGMVGVKIVHDEDDVGMSPRGETHRGESFDLHEALKVCTSDIINLPISRPCSFHSTHA